jgi:hypothetical protein
VPGIIFHTKPRHCVTWNFCFSFPLPHVYHSTPNSFLEHTLACHPFFSPRPCLGSNLDYEVVVVEDSSPDGTYEVAKELQRLYGEDKLKVLLRPGKLGLGTAYIDGLKLVTGNFVILMDADLSHHVRWCCWMLVYCAFPLLGIHAGPLGKHLEAPTLIPPPSLPPLFTHTPSPAAQVHPPVHREAEGAGL